MAIYKHSQFLSQSQSEEFDKIYTPGTSTPHSGIYRCESCAFEASSTEGHPLPPARTCGEHDHRWQCGNGQVRWRLIAYAVHTNNQ